MAKEKIKYYVGIDSNTGKIVGSGTCSASGSDFFSIEVSEEMYRIIVQDSLIYVYDFENEELVENPNYEEDVAAKRRQELDMLVLTPSDVERALYRAKGMDFEDLKTLITQSIPGIDIKGLAIEFRANDFFRGATANGIRLFDVVGQLLGYTSDDIDYLFEHKELPVKEVEE